MQKEEIKCPNCNEKLIRIVYGLPGNELMEKAKKGEVCLGGCIVLENSPKYYCKKCKRKYFENLKDFIEEKELF